MIDDDTDERHAIVLAESVTDLTAQDRGRFVACGSHGGLFSAHAAAAVGVGGIALNDAGIGLDEAGLRGLWLLDSVGIPAVAVRSALSRIGSATETLQGRIAHINSLAAQLGCRSGMSTREALRTMQRATARRPPLGNAELGAAVESRRLVAAAPTEVWTIDSASMVRPSDTGAIVITGSHGGLPGGKSTRAIRYPVLAAAFNDAGGGKDGAGFSRLGPLDESRVYAVTVAAESAHIGEGASTYGTGVVSHVNRMAARIGVAVGDSCVQFVEKVLSTSYGEDDA